MAREGEEAQRLAIPSTNSPRTTCTFLVCKFASVPELKERLGFGVCSYMPLGVVWLEEQPGDNIFFWISTVFSVAALENWKSNWKWEHESTFAARSPCVLCCSTIWAYLRDRHDQAVQNHCSNLNLATVNGWRVPFRCRVLLCKCWLTSSQRAPRW